MLTVSTPATDLTLLSLAELRAATGIAGGQDSELEALNKRVSSTIAAACKVAAAGVTPRTLRQETLTETLRLDVRRCELLLARCPIVSVTSVTEDGTALTSTDYEIEKGSGILRRLDSADNPSWWAAAKIVVVYVAGWETVPDDLKAIAGELAQTMLADGDKQDANLRSESIPGVLDQTWWVDNTDTSPIPEKLMNRLYQGGYVNIWVG